MRVYKMELTKISYNLYKCVDDEGVGKTVRVPEAAFPWMIEFGNADDFKALKELLIPVWETLDKNFELILDEMDRPVLQNIPAEDAEVVKPE